MNFTLSKIGKGEIPQFKVEGIILIRWCRIKIIVKKCFNHFIYKIFRKLISFEYVFEYVRFLISLLSKGRELFIVYALSTKVRMSQTL